MTPKNRIWLLGIGLSALWLGACEGKLKVGDEKRWTGNAADCPSALPSQESACGVAEGEICRYASKDQTGQEDVSLCGCWEAGQGDLRWDCYDRSGGDFTCPSVQPVSGGNCNGNRGAHCDYPPRIECDCALNGDAVWHCQDTSRPMPAPPTTVDGAKPINQLTDADRAAWCKWFLLAYQGPGFPDPPAMPLTSDGMTTSQGCTAGGSFECYGDVPQLPTQYCEGNLALSTCPAPLSELTDCVLTVLGVCTPSPHGCARYLEKPGCTGTMVTSAAEQPMGTGGGPNCSVKVQ